LPGISLGRSSQFDGHSVVGARAST
jgi:hypothetical protein